VKIQSSADDEISFRLRLARHGLIGPQVRKCRLGFTENLFPVQETESCLAQPSRRGGAAQTLFINGLLGSGTYSQVFRRAGYCRLRFPIANELDSSPLLQSGAEGESMGNLSGVVQQLKRERERAQKVVTRLDAAIAALGSSASNGSGLRRPMSAAGRRAVSLAQKARWARKRSNGAAGTTKPKRKMSVAARRKIAAAQRARWAAWKANQKKAA
jgi:hypothetical protein